MNKGVQITSNSNVTMTNTVIQNMRQNIKEGRLYFSEIKSSGSAVEIIDSHVLIDNCTFANNTAINGGAIRISCNYLNECSNTIQNSKFIGNTALEEGGAITYDSYAPLLINNTFEDNLAGFQNELSSYPVKIMMVSNNGSLVELTELNNVPSGLVIDNQISLAVVNVEGEILTSDSFSTIKIVNIDPNSAVRGQNVATLSNGVATFSNTIFQASPGNAKVKYELTSSAINYDVVQYLDPEAYATQVFTVNFRWCKPGEIQLDNSWSTCTTGTYSVVWNETEWRSCPKNANCEAEMISLNKGYWRIDPNSTDIMEWPNEEAWLGGYTPDNEHPVNWAAGYRGLLCNECIIEGETKYERISENQWSKWPDPAMNLMRIIGWAIAVLVFLVILIAVNIQKKEDSNVSVLMRIMTNYLQILAAALSYNLQFPSYVLDFLSSARTVGNSSGVFLSYDCFLMNTHASDMFDNIAYLKVICVALIPVVLFGVSTSGFAIVFYKDKIKFRRYLWVTTITVLFLLHPTITAYSLRIFKWVDIGGGISKVEMDITTEWFSGTHLKWIFLLAIPMVVFYVVGCPTFAFIILYKNRMKLNSPEVLRYIILLYQGLRHEVYYWELVNTFRKCVLLGLHVFIPDNLKLMKALFGCIVLFVVSLLQARIKPFKIGVVSTLEHREMVASILTLYGGLIFAQKDSTLDVLSVIFFIMIFISNARFIILWTFCMTTVFKKRALIEKLGQYIKRVFCLHVSIEDEDYLCYKSKLTTTQNSNSKQKTSHYTTNNAKGVENICTSKPIAKVKKSKFESQNVKKMLSNLYEEYPSSLRTPKKLLSSTKRVPENRLASIVKANRKFRTKNTSKNKTKTKAKSFKKSKPKTKGGELTFSGSDIDEDFIEALKIQKDEVSMYSDVDIVTGKPQNDVVKNINIIYLDPESGNLPKMEIKKLNSKEYTPSSSFKMNKKPFFPEIKVKKSKDIRDNLKGKNSLFKDRKKNP